MKFDTNKAKKITNFSQIRLKFSIQNKEDHKQVISEITEIKDFFQHIAEWKTHYSNKLKIIIVKKEKRSYMKKLEMHSWTYVVKEHDWS